MLTQDIEITGARLTLDNTWAELAPLISEAELLEAQANRNPTRWSDPWVEAHTRWLSIFERELTAVRTAHDAAARGANLTAEELNAASQAGSRLLEIIHAGRRRVPQPA